ncbi:hypothetical protein E2C01_080577 [Portunus trituberculatus]|uniref:Uncharacterized protein n=1 Tax=Portunus trituberculatus TaxID=210409 RepID=A0A5B7ITT7_PORTR|nr:hypothetical protein [Portunus trituberculatus]
MKENIKSHDFSSTSFLLFFFPSTSSSGFTYYPSSSSSSSSSSFSSSSPSFSFSCFSVALDAIRIKHTSSPERRPKNMKASHIINRAQLTSRLARVLVCMASSERTNLPLHHPPWLYVK